MRLPIPRLDARNPIKQTRLRLLLSYMGVTAVILVLFAFGFYNYVRGTLVERIDDTLDHVVELIERSLRTVPGPDGRPVVNIADVFAGGDDDPTVEMDLIYLEWFGSDGRPLRSTAVFPKPLPLVRGYLHETVEVTEDHKLRQVTRPVRRAGQLLGYLRVSHQWFEVDKPSRQLFADLLVGAVVTMAMIGLGGWFLTELALRPVRRAYDQLRQFTADASHELRTPLAAIQANVQVALADPQPTVEDYRSRLEVTERLTRRMGRLVSDLLFLARNEGGPEHDAVSCNLSELVQQVVEEQAPLARAAELQVQFKSNGPAVVNASPDQLLRLLTNLLSNAIRYTPPGGRVQLSVRREPREVEIIVKDTGIGIPAAHLPQIFERFYRVDSARSRQAGGSGLGLAIARTIAENHGGTISVESTPGAGTTFSVRLPARPGIQSAVPDESNQALPLEG